MPNLFPHNENVANKKEFESINNPVFQRESFISTVIAGTAPYACTSTTVNTNLNADMVDGYHATSFLGGGLSIGNVFGTEAATVIPPNLLCCTKFTALQTTSISNLGIFLNDLTNGDKLMLGIYSNAAGTDAPSALLGQTNEYTMATVDKDSIVIVPLQASVSLTLGTKYWIAFWDKTNSVGVMQFENATRTTLGQYRSLAYSTSLPNPIGAITGATYGYCMCGL